MDLKHVVIVGGGAALAQPLIEHLMDGWNPPRITAVCRPGGTFPDQPSLTRDGIAWFGAVTALGFVPWPIDVLITMPGASCAVKLDQADDADRLRALDANLLAVARAFRELLPAVRDGGNVVVVGSVVGRTGAYGAGPYAAAKAGLIGLVRTAALEHAARGVCVNLLELGHVNCGMGERLAPKVRERALAAIPLRRFAEPAEAVEAIVWLGRVRFMTGGIFPLTGGL